MPTDEDYDQAVREAEATTRAAGRKRHEERMKKLEEEVKIAAIVHSPVDMACLTPRVFHFDDPRP